jgi:pimeloyl-ACP methyl ester carboxylesterase
MTPTRFTFAGHGDLSLNAWDYGGDGPLLLLCHCTGTLARVWDPAVRALNGAFRCIALDTRGHGDSAFPPSREKCAWDLSGRDLLRLVDHLNPDSPPFAAGHSAGGAHVGYATMLRPGVFAKIALIDSIIGPDSIFGNMESPLAALVRRRVNIFPSRESAKERLGSTPPMTHWHTEALDAYIAHGLRDREDGQVELKLPGNHEAWFYELGGATDLFAGLKDIATPALVIAGEMSDVRLLPELQHKELPNSTLHQVQGAGHFVPQEKPREIAQLLLRLLEDGVPPRAAEHPVVRG